MVLKDGAGWLYLSNSIHEDRIEATPGVSRGPAGHQDMFDGVDAGGAEVASRTEGRSVE